MMIQPVIPSQTKIMSANLGSLRAGRDEHIGQFDGSLLLEESQALLMHHVHIMVQVQADEWHPRKVMIHDDEKP